ncbi:MAG: DNA polymerase IV [Bacilli bacterium]
MNQERVIFHIDVNNAFLSWTAVEMLNQGYKTDIRTIPSVIGGDEAKRCGIVVAKSPVAKKYGVVTAETLYSARKKCPKLEVFPADHSLYNRESDKLYEYFLTLTPQVERYSVDECFLDMSGMRYLHEDILLFANEIKNEIYAKFGVTVNIGIANCKLCAKMASDFEKPNKIHTLFPGEVKTKMWPLPVSELFMVGKSSSDKLINLGIKTIGDLANADYGMLKRYFKSMAITMHNYANGIDDSLVISERAKNKSISTTETLVTDITDKAVLKKVLKRQSEEVGRDLRKQGFYARCIAIILRTGKFVNYTHQMKLVNATNISDDIYKFAVELLNKAYQGEPIRLIGIRLTDFQLENTKQLSLFDNYKTETTDKVQKVVDSINDKFGTNSIIPASILEEKDCKD